MTSIPRGQRGATLLVSMIMLVVITLLVVTSFRLSKGNLQIVSNAQTRSQNLSAAQQTIEELVSHTDFVTTPTNAIPAPCNAVANTKCVDINGDGVADVTVTVTPSCLSAKTIPVAALSLTDPEDVRCMVGLSQDQGIVGSVGNDSLCANQLWNITAVAADSVTRGQYVADQGVSVRRLIDDACP